MTAPSQPAQNTAPATSASALKSEKAIPTASTVLVNGKEVKFDAYNINGFNYFKLRDIAMAVNHSEKNFSVGFDSANNMIVLKAKQLYEPAGGELAAGDGKEKTATPTKSSINKDGTAISPDAYNIGGFNYFKLRDICKEFDIGVGYNSSSKTITIDTRMGYSE